ncbi:tyrosine-type recombinase/integrase [Geodermatophilus sp. URMC 62]|uniref:tyrosine-type recombinase/integrase n=1 Tax=Geodermatophilus sp. URMC 62 TaxID=3423414 RepID=UPI00406D1DCD
MTSVHGRGEVPRCGSTRHSGGACRQTDGAADAGGTAGLPPAAGWRTRSVEELPAEGRRPTLARRVDRPRAEPALPLPVVATVTGPSALGLVPAGRRHTCRRRRLGGGDECRGSHAGHRPPDPPGAVAAAGPRRPRRAHPTQPGRRDPTPSGAARRARFLTCEQVERLAEAAGEYGDAVRLLAYTGLRFGELAGLRVRRVDLLRRRLTIAESATEVGGTVEFGAPKTRQQRTVPFPVALAEPLGRRCEGKGPDDLVITSPQGAVLRSGNSRRRFFDPGATAAGLENLSPHDLRHTAASLLGASGAHVKAVQRMLGHASAAMTLDVYSGPFDDDLSALAERMDAAHQEALTERVVGAGRDPGS